MSAPRANVRVVARNLLFALLSLAVALPVSGALGGDEKAPPIPGPSVGSYSWPVAGPVIREFEPPAGPFGPGHRGIDIAAHPRSRVRSAGPGVVAFAGRIAGDLHLSIDHPDGVRTSYSFLSHVGVEPGAPVAKGQVVGATGDGHPAAGPAHLHFGARFAGRYIDPMLLLARGSLVGLIRLAPLQEGSSRAPP